MALDSEAYERATSVYFPTRAIHMLPTPLSAGLCSLVPYQDRLALVAEMRFDGHGERLTTEIYEAVFRSQARLTYPEVESVVRTGQFADDEPKVVPLHDESVRQAVTRSVLEMRELQDLIFARRKRRGSLDFDLPEAEFVFAEEESEGEHAIENIIKGTRLSSHRLIEEFMIAANEAVAEYLTEREIPMPYRIHEQPDAVKIQEFFRQLQKLPEMAERFARPKGKKAKKNAGYDEDWLAPGVLARLLEEIRELPQARFLNQMLLQSLKLAIYSPANKGHYGLASECYAHFTSPIRRYPDLILHRVLKTYLWRRRGLHTFETLKENCEHCSDREQNAVAAEREIIQFYKCRFMKDRLGRVFNGRIVKITTFGFFVELDEIYVDGFVPLELLEEDQFSFQPEKQALVGRRHKFVQGDRLEVQLVSVDLDRRRITFALPKAEKVKKGSS
jgi:ribonuclease R